MRRAAADIECTLNEIARLQNPFRIDRADHNIDCVFLETLELSELPHRNQLAVDEKRVEPLALRPARYVGVNPFRAFTSGASTFSGPRFTAVSRLADIAQRSASRPANRSPDKIASRFSQTGAGENGKPRYVATVDLPPPRVTRCSLATLAARLPRDRPSAFPVAPRTAVHTRHAVEKSSLPFSEEESNATVDLPEPLSP